MHSVSERYCVTRLEDKELTIDFAYDRWLLLSEKCVTVIHASNVNYIK